MIVGELYLVRWRDSRGGGFDWEIKSPQRTRPPKAAVICTVGWCASLSEDAIEIVPHVEEIDDDDDRNEAGGVTIPVVAIIDVKALKA